MEGVLHGRVNQKRVYATRHRFMGNVAKVMEDL